MLTTDRVAGGALALLALFVLVESRKLPLGSLRAPGPAYMPVGLALILLVFGIAVLVMGRQAPTVASVGWREWRHAAAIIGTCAFSALALERLGYRLTMTVGVILLVGLVERKGVVITLAFALALAFGSFLLFDTLLRVPLPRGPLGL
jgi:Tripartite tricarboxylate transporter TctB family